MNFLYLIVSIFLMAIAAYSMYIFGPWIASAGILGTIGLVIIWNSVDGRDDNDLELVFITLLFIAGMGILLIQDSYIRSLFFRKK